MNTADPKPPGAPLPAWVLPVALGWTVLVASLLIWQIMGDRDTMRRIARAEARTHFNKDQAVRLWAAAHGGVYVPTDARTPPNPHLSHVPERDIETPSGRKLTMMNPAYILRQMMEEYSDVYGTHGHITSLKLLRPENAADAWETNALKAFETGIKEVFEFTEIRGEPYLRLMRPLVTEKGCMKCHSAQGYQVGDVRGGIGVSLPLAPLIAEHRSSSVQTAVALGLIWLLGLAGLSGASGLARRRMAERLTAEEALRKSEYRHRIVADFTDDWEYWRLPDGSLTYVSPSCERLTGYPAREFLQDPELLMKVIHPEDRPLFVRHLADLRDAPVDERHAEMEFRILTRSGEERWIGHVCRQVFASDGKPLGRRGSNRDITARKLAEAEILKLNAELEQRVRDRTVQLETANKELEAFSYSVSHDLRAPLRAIHGFARILQEDYAPRLDAEGRRLLDVISVEAVRMGRLIDELLKFSRLNSQPLQKEMVSHQALASEALEQLAAVRSGRRIEMAVGDLPASPCDPALLLQVWVNLLSNALKYTGPRAVAEIVIGGRQEGDDAVYFVKDNGVGFDMKYADKLFGVFQRLHTSAEFEGVGVGLALVQRIVHRHGGRVWAEGRVDEGATFYFSLPNPEGKR
ncbi:MAG: ATP-binding protein [Limisphaerales bacterium]